MNINTKTSRNFRRSLGVVLLIVGCLFFIREFVGNADAPNILTGLLMTAIGVLNLLRPQNPAPENQD